MPHFFIKKEEINDNFITLIDEQTLFHLVKVLRVKVGNKVKFINENRIVFDCLIEDITKLSLRARILSSKESNKFLKYNLCLIQSVLALDSQNLLIANATQTGVKEIFPVISDNCSVSASSLENKLSKWEKIAFENFKQCERADMVKINNISSLKAALLQFKKENLLIFAEKDCNISINDSIADIDKNEKIGIVIGPEGGFSNDEFEYFKNNNYKLISLGNMIYKAPNAVVAAVSNIVSRI